MCRASIGDCTAFGEMPCNHLFLLEVAVDEGLGRAGGGARAVRGKPPFGEEAIVSSVFLQLRQPPVESGHEVGRGFVEGDQAQPLVVKRWGGDPQRIKIEVGHKTLRSEDGNRPCLDLLVPDRVQCEGDVGELVEDQPRDFLEEDGGGGAGHHPHLFGLQVVETGNLGGEGDHDDRARLDVEVGEGKGLLEEGVGTHRREDRIILLFLEVLDQVVPALSKDGNGELFLLADFDEELDRKGEEIVLKSHQLLRVPARVNPHHIGGVFGGPTAREKGDAKE